MIGRNQQGFIAEVIHRMANNNTGDQAQHLWNCACARGLDQVMIDTGYRNRGPGWCLFQRVIR